VELGRSQVSRGPGAKHQTRRANEPYEELAESEEAETMDDAIAAATDA